MNYRVAVYVVFLSYVLASPLFAQRPLRVSDLEANAFTFDITPQGIITDTLVLDFLFQQVDRCQFVGLAELHRSEQLSRFTAALLPILHQADFRHFLLEMGPVSADRLERISVGDQIGESIRQLNNTYGHRESDMTPLAGVDGIDDTLFVRRAAELGFRFHGIGQEFLFAYEMHLDQLYLLLERPSQEQTALYRKLKKRLRNMGRKSARNADYAYNCVLKGDKSLQSFLDYFAGKPMAKTIIDALQDSWDIYCQYESGEQRKGLRSEYLKRNLAPLLRDSSYQPPLFLKLGRTHLVRQTTPDGMEAVGTLLTKRAARNGSGFLTIRHMSRFRNGEDMLDNPEWKGVHPLIATGKADRWTLVNLRPLRQKLRAGHLAADQPVAFEIENYDLLLIPPDDRRVKANF